METDKKANLKDESQIQRLLKFSVPLFLTEKNRYNDSKGD